MHVRPFVRLTWMAVLLLGAANQLSGANESHALSALPPPASDTVFRAHWIGKRQLAVDGTAYYITRIWDLPSTSAIEARAFDKLAASPWLLLKSEPVLANAPVGALRVLFDNLVYEESYLEIRSATNGGLQVAMAIRLDQEAGQGWQANLAIACQSLTGFRPEPRRDKLPGWQIIHPQAPAQVGIARADDWTIVGVATTNNELMEGLISRVNAGPDPFGAKGTQRWVRLEADLNWLAKVLGLTGERRQNLPRVSAVWSGDGGHVFTDCRLTFRKSLEAELQPWNLPQDAIGEPLAGFVAARGLPLLFNRLPGWSQLPLGDVPDQVYAWSQAANPFQLYLAIPVADSEARVGALSTHLLESVNPWLRTSGPEINGQPCPLFHPMPDIAGVLWGRMEGLQPFAQAVSTGEQEFLLAGLLPAAPSKPSTGLRQELVRSLDAATNLLCLGWEDTSSRLSAWGPVLQTTRAVTGHAPMPESCPTLKWLEILASRTRETRTTVTRTGPHTLDLHRKSTLGFTAAELHVLADWLESPRFPQGLHTFLAPGAKSQAQ